MFLRWLLVLIIIHPCFHCPNCVVVIVCMSSSFPILRVSIISFLYTQLYSYIQIASPERSRPAKRYQSSYRPRCSATAPATGALAPLEFECFKMKRRTCSVNGFGEPKVVYSEEEEEIMIAKGWQAHAKAGKPYQGYLGQGLTKFVFRVSSTTFLRALIAT